MTTPNLPNAEHQTPACGACGTDTASDPYGRPGWVCAMCLLRFDPDTLEASYLYDNVDPCGHPCTNRWHADGTIRAGWRHECAPCALPSGHGGGTVGHYNPCRAVRA